MPVKYWSFAGLMLTYWCNARCASCYLCCGPHRREEMSVEEALGYWESLAAASPTGCRVHLTGGEPFGDWDRLLELCRRAKAQGLGPLEKIETNAFWATDAGLVKARLEELDRCGMGKLVISTDPYHQEFVPMHRVRLAARVAGEVLGEHRVQVRWRDWLKDGFDTDGLPPSRRVELFARYAAGGRDRFNGRAVVELTRGQPFKPLEALADNPCDERLLRSRHVHIDPQGRLMPGTCSGIVLGHADRESVGDIWRGLADDYASRPVTGTLASGGPVRLAKLAEATGFVPQAGYAGKCHLCWDVRKHLVDVSSFSGELGPAWLYQDE